MLIVVLNGLPAAIAELTGQIADVTEAFAALKAGGDVTPKELSALLMTKSEALTTVLTSRHFSALRAWEKCHEPTLPQAIGLGIGVELGPPLRPLRYRYTFHLCPGSITDIDTNPGPSPSPKA